VVLLGDPYNIAFVLDFIATGEKNGLIDEGARITSRCNYSMYKVIHGFFQLPTTTTSSLCF
jgi:hypothetical protein